MDTALDTAHEIIAGSDLEFQQIKYLTTSLCLIYLKIMKRLPILLFLCELNPKSRSFFCLITQLRHPSQTDDDKALDEIMHIWLLKPLARNVGFGKPFILD